MKRGPKRGFVLAICALLTLTGSAGVKSASSAEPLCTPGRDLGAVALRLSTNWRPDQKEPEDRERRALEAATRVLSELRCGRYIGHDGAAAARAKTLIAIELREFGPLLTLSFPALWSLKTDVDFTLAANDRKSGAALFSFSERRQSGGAFVVQSMSAVSETFEEALRLALYGPLPAPQN